MRSAGWLLVVRSIRSMLRLGMMGYYKCIECTSLRVICVSLPACKFISLFILHSRLDSWQSKESYSQSRGIWISLRRNSTRVKDLDSEALQDENTYTLFTKIRIVYLAN